MTDQEQPQVSTDTLIKDHRRIDQLVQEVEKLIHILEDERLVEPSRMRPLKRELAELKGSG